jgi:hypothetical protein
MTADFLRNSKIEFECTLFYEVLYFNKGKLGVKIRKDKKYREEKKDCIESILSSAMNFKSLFITAI